MLEKNKLQVNSRKIWIPYIGIILLMLFVRGCGGIAS